MTDFNLNCLKHSPNCAAVINADHNCHEASTANEEIAGGLHLRHCLCEGARVMLTSNLKSLNRKRFGQRRNGNGCGHFVEDGLQAAFTA